MYCTCNGINFKSHLSWSMMFNSKFLNFSQICIVNIDLYGNPFYGRGYNLYIIIINHIKSLTNIHTDIVTIVVQIIVTTVQIVIQAPLSMTLKTKFRFECVTYYFIKVNLFANSYENPTIYYKVMAQPSHLGSLAFGYWPSTSRHNLNHITRKFS